MDTPGTDRLLLRWKPHDLPSLAPEAIRYYRGLHLRRATPVPRRSAMSSQQPPSKAQTPRGVNHLVLNVRDLDVSHKFWTEIMGFKMVAELKPKPNRGPLKMRFYSGVDEHGDVNHHDLALAEIPKDQATGGAEDWSL